jgi:hypothetical protein
MTTSSRILTLAFTLSSLLPALPAAAQESRDEHGDHADHAAEAAADHAMDHDVAPMGAMEHAGHSTHAAHAAHLRLTPLRPPTHADSVRARAIADTLRRAIARYRDVRAAEADGYAMFAPQVKTQRVYHFTRNWSAVRNAFGFDPARPTSLLYTKDAAGRFALVGAMYTAPKGAGDAQLDARVPLSIARWHQHVDICVPKRAERARWAERGADGRPLFGPEGAIATREACDAAGGRFFPEIFGWMVHVELGKGEFGM